MRDRGFDLRGDVLDLILEGEILRLQLRSIWARRFEMLRQSTLANERYTSIRLREALQDNSIYTTIRSAVPGRVLRN